MTTDPRCIARRLPRHEWAVVRYVGYFTVFMWAVWLVTEWPHRHWWWLWGTLIAIGVWALFSVSIIAQDRQEQAWRAEKRERKLKTHAVCPTCAGEGWVPRA